jgi:hypothetical protein
MAISDEKAKRIEQVIHGVMSEASAKAAEELAHFGAGLDETMEAMLRLNLDFEPWVIAALERSK